MYRLILLIFCWIVYCAPSIAETADVNIPLNLTNEEKSWLAQHRLIRVGVDPAYPPYDFRTDDGNYHGISLDYIDIIDQKLNISIKIVPGLTWSEIMSRIKQHKIDVLSLAADTAERRKFLTFTKPHISLPIVIMTQKDNDSIHSLTDLNGRVVAMVQNYFYVNEFTKNNPGIKPFFVATPLDALNAVVFGQADGVVINLGVGLIFVKNMLYLI